MPNYIEGGVPGGGDDGDPATSSYRPRPLAALRNMGDPLECGPSGWEAGSGAVFNLATNDRRPEGWTSADAAGLADLPGTGALR